MAEDIQIKPTDLRGILKYVPQFNNHVFVISIDGSIIAYDNFTNVITDIAVLRSLNIKVILVHGCGKQIKTLSKERNIKISDAYGSGPTNDDTLSLAIEASSRVNQKCAEAPYSEQISNLQ